MPAYHLPWRGPCPPPGHERFRRRARSCRFRRRRCRRLAGPGPQPGRRSVSSVACGLLDRPAAERRRRLGRDRGLHARPGVEPDADRRLRGRRRAVLPGGHLHPRDRAHAGAADGLVQARLEPADRRADADALGALPQPPRPPQPPHLRHARRRRIPAAGDVAASRTAEVPGAGAAAAASAGRPLRRARSPVVAAPRLARMGADAGHGRRHQSVLPQALPEARGMASRRSSRPCASPGW